MAAKKPRESTLPLTQSSADAVLEGQQNVGPKPPKPPVEVLRSLRGMGSRRPKMNQSPFDPYNSLSIKLSTTMDCCFLDVESAGTQRSSPFVRCTVSVGVHDQKQGVSWIDGHIKKRDRIHY